MDTVGTIGVIIAFLTLICAGISAWYDYLGHRNKRAVGNQNQIKSTQNLSKRSWFIFGSAGFFVLIVLVIYLSNIYERQSCADISPATLALLPSGTNYRIFGGNRISLQRCQADGTHVDCYFYLTKTTPGDEAFYYDSANIGRSSLYDDNEDAHGQISGTFVDKKCNPVDPVDPVDLSQGQTAEFIQRFSGPATGLTSAKIVFPQTGWGILSLSVP